MNYNLTIKSWAEDDRPREKLLQKGKSNLSDSELIAILLGSGSRDKSALELAKEMLSSVSNNLAEFAKLSHEQLTRFKGVGDAKAISLIAALEIARRRNNIEEEGKLKIVSAESAYQLLKPIFQDLIHEQFHIILLNRVNNLIGVEMISSGGFSSTVVDGRMVFKKALEKNAQGIILCHNHPSGDPRPSKSDIDLTNRLVRFAEIIDISILDHLIFTDNTYFSFSESGLLNK